MSIAPSADRERYELIDALRGAALAGVLLMNLGEFSLFEHLDTAQRQALATAGFDRWAGLLLHVVVEGKAITVFSLLFGLGFAMQLERASRAGVDGLHLYLRRLGVLLAIGLLHACLLWSGDILMRYALLALVLLPFRHASDRALLGIGLTLGVCWPLATPLMSALTSALISDKAMDAEQLAVFGSGSYGATIAQHTAVTAWTWLSDWGVIPFVFARFLLGYWAGRKRLLQAPVQHRVLLRRIALAAGAIGVAATLAVLLHARLTSTDPGPAITPGQIASEIGRQIGILGLGIAYACSFGLLWLQPAWQRGLRWLVPVGRMAVSNYLAQSVAGVLIFYGWGLGVGPRFGVAGILVAWAVLFAAQVVWSRWWLRRFRFGPMEWLWRALTYGQRPPMRREDPETAPQGM